MSGPRAMFVALATSTAMLAQAQTGPIRIEPMPGGATSTLPANPAAAAAPSRVQPMTLPPAVAERIRKNSKMFATDVALEGQTNLQEFIADKSASCSDLTSLYASQQEILKNQRAISKDPAMRAILEEELVKAKVPEATATTKAQMAKRCPTSKLDG